MKKLIFAALLISAFLFGKYFGEMSVLLNQNIWSDDEYHYAEYNGEVHYYE